MIQNKSLIQNKLLQSLDWGIYRIFRGVGSVVSNGEKTMPRVGEEIRLDNVGSLEVIMSSVCITSIFVLTALLL